MMDVQRAADLNRLLRASPELLGLPLIDITACGEWAAAYDEDQYGPMHVGMHGCLTPPFREVILHGARPRRVRLLGGQWIERADEWTDVYVVQSAIRPLGFTVSGAAAYVLIMLGQVGSRGPCVFGGVEIGVDDVGRPLTYDDRVAVWPTEDYVRHPDVASGLCSPEDLAGQLIGMLHGPLFALSLMHAKNVTLTTDHVARAVRRSRALASIGELTLKTLEITPGSGTRGGGSVSTIGEALNALHLCRGSFATYTETRRLFGRYAGTFWRSACLKGTADRGVVAKDYQIVRVRNADHPNE